MSFVGLFKCKTFIKKNIYHHIYHWYISTAQTFPPNSKKNLLISKTSIAVLISLGSSTVCLLIVSSSQPHFLGYKFCVCQALCLPMFLVLIWICMLFRYVLATTCPVLISSILSLYSTF